MKKVYVDGRLCNRFAEFVSGRDMGFQIVSDSVESVDLRIETCGDERLESKGDLLYSGGWISCGNARAMAGDVGVGLKTFGELLDHLDVKVKSCELGCF